MYTIYICLADHWNVKLLLLSLILCNVGVIGAELSPMMRTTKDLSKERSLRSIDLQTGLKECTLVSYDILTPQKPSFHCAKSVCLLQRCKKYPSDLTCPGSDPQR